MPLASLSRYSRSSFIYPDPIESPDAFVEFLHDRVQKKSYDIVIPVTENTVQPLAKERRKFESVTVLAVAKDEALDVVFNKQKTFALAAELDVPIPQTRTLKSLSDLDELLPGLTYPTVVKPARSISEETKGKRTSLRVRYAHCESELVAFATPILASTPILLQEYFRGVGVGVEVLAQAGETVFSFQHRRLHELPLTGGGSCLRESVPVNQSLLEYSERLLAAIKWDGVAMVEFKMNEETGECRLMEINGRFWGSLPLAVHAGADFPFFLYQLQTSGIRPTVPRARAGLLCRKLSSDIYWAIQVFRPSHDEPLVEWPTRMSVLRDACLMFSPRHRFDVQSWSDSKPGIVDIFRTARWFVERAWAATRDAYFLRKHRKIRKTGSLLRRLRDSKSVLFVCYGNINRSCVAHHYFAKNDPSRGKVSVASAGFHQEAGREVDPVMKKIASSSSVSLEHASSRFIDQAMVDAADTILVMEVRHLIRIRTDFPGARSKSFLLAAAVQDTSFPLEIGDPYGQPYAEYERCFVQVTRAVDAIIDTQFRGT